ncbi:kinase [Hirsutella rhossiliensis]|uniref:non-specific serine/threonine protein kinase n=1 Tax=Hirsutella rhossiliensis TaxID=111463 RepID=A0A9P8N7Y7_9HYPO|nr:kinase [Hirsutella rhossiliensis]KAH0966282.1 kinase [Hirsutella rhossiliensis]
MDSSQLHQALSLHAHPRLPTSSSLPLRTASSTPMSSPGLFSPSPSQFHQPTSLSESNTPAPALGSPYLHPLQNHRVRETHKALIDSDIITGRKSINQYEVIEEIGRGMHGKVKLARNTQTAENVAIKIIPRFSKKRRLGRVTAMSPQDKTKKEIAILKKIRHPNVVALLEVIDDPELKKIYMVLEHVELGEVVWRKKGLPHICQYERRRIEREMRGDAPTAEEEQYDQILERRQALKELKRARLAQNYAGPSDYWSVEYGAADERSSAGPWSRIPSREDFAVVDGQPSPAGPAPPELDEMVDWAADMETPIPQCGSYTAFDGATHGSHRGEGFRPRSSSVADSIISHMSSVDYNPRAHDPFAEDFSFVPCFTMDQARSTFRDTVLGLEYLHYQGVVHRDIKPANLLWTRDHRVKISDFGVSYFGRPIRDGELDETVSESEAKDFDDDLELAKTVGTPAFFAPELCYTDVDSKEQPKVSEQIDVWSLGVTLYCLIYARIPFLAEDEFQMFRKIATDEVHISRRRLKPVDPSTSPSATSLYKRQNAHPYRDDNDLEYEEVDNLLYDLLRQMLIKNPEKRIRLRDIKRHPWVVQGITNPIQVDEKDMSFAVVPLNFLERARSVVKKAVGKVMQPLVERGDSRSRRRAASSAASSAGDSVLRNTGPPTNYTNDRRGSFRGDDYFFQTSRDGPAPAGHLAPSSSGTNVRAETVEYDPLATVLPPLQNSRDPNPAERSSTENDGPSRHSHRQHGNSRPPQSLFQLRPPPSEARPSPASLWCGGHRESQREEEPVGRRARGPECKGEDSSRSASADRALFVSTDKRAHAQVALSNAVAPGSIQGPRRLKSMRSIELKRGPREHSSTTPSPLSSSPQTAAATYQHGQPRSDPNFHARQQTHVDERPRTAHRVETSSGAERAKLHSHDPLVPETPAALDVPSPSRGNTITTIKSSSVESMEAIGTPLTSPSETTSPSDPSLPALLSGASSVSADIEGELLGKPGIVKGQSPRLEAEDSMTRPAPAKEPSTSLGLDHVFENAPAMESGPLALHIVPAGPGSPGTVGSSDRSPAHDDDDDDGSDDGILLMAKPRRRTSLMLRASPVRPVEAKRRDTGASTASNETAKRIPVHDDDGNPCLI